MVHDVRYRAEFDRTLCFPAFDHKGLCAGADLTRR